MESGATKIDEYISIVRELTENGRETECNDESLIQIALNLGFTSTEWQVVEQKFEEYCIRAENYYKHQHYHQTIEQCQSALQIKPINKKALKLLVRAYLSAWHETKSLEEKDAAIFYAEKIIQYYPSDQEAYALLQQTKTKPKPKLILMLVLVMVIGISAAFYYFNLARLQNRQPNDIKPTQSNQATTDTVIIWQHPDYVITTINFDTTAYGFKIFDTRLENYNQTSMAIKCRANIFVKNVEINELKFDVMVFDAQKRLLNTMPIWVIDYQPAVRLGDVLPFRLLFYDSVMPVFPLDVQIIQQIIDVRPMAAQYPKAKIITVENAGDFPTYQLQIRERRSIFTTSDLMNQTAHNLSIENCN